MQCTSPLLTGFSHTNVIHFSRTLLLIQTRVYRLLMADFSQDLACSLQPLLLLHTTYIVSLQNGDFKVAAIIVAASTVQARLAPQCISAAVAVHGEVRTPVKISDICDLDIRNGEGQLG